MKRTLLIMMSAAAVATACSEEPINPGITAGIKIETIGVPDTCSIKVLFTPDEKTTYFDYAIGTDNDYIAFDQGTLETIQRQDGNEPLEAEFPNLKPNTVYSIFAKSYTDKGQSAGIFVHKASTLDNQFKVELQYLSDVSAGYRMTIPQEYVSCRYYLGSASEKEAFVADQVESSEVSEIPGAYTCVNFYDLDPSTEYVFYAIGKDRSGIETELFEIPATTYASDACPNAEFDFDIDIYQGTYTITPNSMCGRIIASITERGTVSWVLEEGFYNDIPLLLENWNSIKFNHTNEAADGSPLTLAMTTPQMENGTDLELYVALYDTDGNISGVRHFNLATPEAVPELAAPSPVEIEVTNISNAGAVYQFTADQSALGFFYETVEADWYDELKETDPELSEYYLAETFFANYKTLTSAGLQGLYHHGNGSFTWAETSGQPEFRYYAAAVPINMNGPREGGWGNTTLVSYTTLAE